jgi:nicotinate (nicotinamide) nucleotide adenylyltransferase
MDFLRRADTAPSRLAVFPGTFNPVTVAHLALAKSALREADEILFVLPRVFPHKPYSGASFEDRTAILLAAVNDEPRFSIGSSTGGLFAEIAAECREEYGPEVKLSFLCGADAAHRIATWDYGDPATFARMMRQFDLLVAERGDNFALPHRRLDLPGDYAHVSATEVRERIARGENWEHLVPAPARDFVRRIYGSSTARP